LRGRGDGRILAACGRALKTSETLGDMPRNDRPVGAATARARPALTSHSSTGDALPAEETLVPLLAEHRVSWDTLHDRYGPLLALVQTLIGVVPNCDRYLEIWEPAFRTYNILVPNFLNLPFSVFRVGGAPAEIVGMGMYVASRTAGCPYCSAHSCSFALRRGASVEKMAQALLGGTAPFTPGELATVAVARSLAQVPSTLTADERESLTRCFGAGDAEWIVAGIAMMGFLNKFMDAVGVELESSVVAETAATLGPGWSAGKAGRALDPADGRRAPPPPADSLWTRLRIVPYMPAALRLDRQWLRGVPNGWPAVGTFLRERTGHDFPVLARLRHARLLRSVAAMLRENLDPATTVVGLDVKVLAGVVFAEIVADPALGADVRALAARHGVSASALDAAQRFARTGVPDDLHSEPQRAALVLARAASPSPAQIDAGVVAACRRGGLSAPAVVEVVTWLAVLQTLHRLFAYHRAE
jgi:alkylhydroperoxidase family enzyme